MKRWTEQQVRLLTVKDGPWVGMGQGLYLRIHQAKGGSVTKRWCYREGKKFRGLGLSWPDTTLAEARKEVARFKLGLKQAESTTTFQQAFDSFRDTVLQPQGRGGHRTAILENHILPRLGSKKLRNLKRADVAAAVAQLRDKPTRAHEALRLTKNLLAHAVDNGWVDANVAAGARPASIVGRKPGARDRNLCAAELKAFLRASFDHPRGAFVRFVLATGVRLNEATAARWEWVDKDGWLVLPAEQMKSGREHRVFLSDYAREQVATSVGCFFLPIKVKGEHIAYRTAQRATEEIAAAAGVENFTTHDLRRTARSFWSELGVDPMVAERMLAHQLPGLLGVYDRASRDEPARGAWQRWGEYLRATEREVLGSNVVPLRSAA